MDKDRTIICKIVGEMLEAPDENGIYPTTTAYNALEKHVDGARAEAIGWAYSLACAYLDKGYDLRKAEVPALLARAERDLA